VHVSAEIIWLHRDDEKSVDQIDFATAIDVAIRDLRDIEGDWGTAAGLRRLRECRELLVRAFASQPSGDRDADPLP
jgi:hypothetical protein